MAKRCRTAIYAGALALALAAATSAQARLQCVPYARAHSEISLRGDAHTWWAKANGRFARGAAPAVGAVLAFRGTARMPSGHVAVVRRIVDSRHLLIDHANWSRPGAVEQSALAEDVSPDGDWSAVRVWYGPAQRLGLRTNPVFGFIYANPARQRAATPWIEAQSVIWLDSRQAARLTPENVALFEG